MRELEGSAIQVFEKWVTAEWEGQQEGREDEAIQSKQDTPTHRIASLAEMRRPGA